MQHSLATMLAMYLFVSHHDLELNRHSIPNRDWKTIEIELSEEYIGRYKDVYGNMILAIVISLDVSRTWVPAKWNVNDDTRRLGITVLLEPSSAFVERAK